MEYFSGKKAVILYGPPGSGKGTLASLLAKNFDFIHFDTGRYLGRLLANPAYRKDKIIQREKKLFEKGILCTPAWVLKIVSQAARKIAAADWGLVFSGSPRTILEAFGDPEGIASRSYGAGKKQTGLIKILEKIYGRNNIFIFELKAKPQTSIKRNLTRVVCTVCGQPSLFLYTGKIPCCAVCAGPLEKRIDDDSKIIKTRLIEYQKRTQPIFKGLKKEGYQVIKIDGEPAPYKVFQKIVQKIKV